MIFKLLLLPVWVVRSLLSIVSTLLKIVLGTGIRTLRFGLRHAFGAFVGVVAGLILGRRHLKVRLFAKKK